MVIFHQAAELTSDLGWASSLRPLRMYEAFQEIGEEVFDLTGTCGERLKKGTELLGRLRDQEESMVYYSESVNTFTALTWMLNKPMQPWHMEFDCRLAGRLKAHGIRTGLFYRDIHWRYDVIPTPGWKRFLKDRIRPFFAMRELQYWRASLDVLFLPHEKMANVIPGTFPNSDIRALPPGGDPHEMNDGDQSRRKGGDGLHLLYVGSIKPPVYDLRPYLDAMETGGRSSLTLVTREDGLRMFGDLYRFDRRAKVTVHHAQGSGLEPYYRKADVALAVMEGSDYLAFAMPVKIFEAISFGLPLIVTACQEVVAEFVMREKIGWVVNSPEEFKRLLRHLNENRDEIDETRRRVLAVRENHTWEARAREVVDVLTQVRMRGKHTEGIDGR